MVGFALGFLKFGSFVKKYWYVFVGIAVALSGAYAINLMVRNYNDAIEDAIVANERADKWKNSSEQWEASFRQSESFREQETRSAVSSADRERVVCNQRVADARQSRERINTITRVVPNENNQVCPPAGVISTNELRDALGAN